MGDRRCSAGLAPGAEPVPDRPTEHLLKTHGVADICEKVLPGSFASLPVSARQNTPNDPDLDAWIEIAITLHV
jgi:hypothetical protein